MRKSALFISLLLLFVASVRSQKPAQVLEQLAASSPIEKVYLHFDREEYIAGETAWFKAYMYSDYQPDTISTSLYVELLNSSSEIISRKILPVVLGNTYGQIEIPDSLQTGIYLVRAYSPTMLNQGEDFAYKRTISVFGKSAVMEKPREKLIRLEFFPEGGNFIEGSPNTMAFKVTDEYGLPVNVKGSVLDNKGEAVAAFTTYHDGMGMFDIHAAPGVKYYAVLDEDPNQKKYPLPPAVKSGIVFRIMPDPQGRYYEVLQKAGDENFQAAYMIGQMQHHVVFNQTLATGKDWLTGVINTSRLYSGILQITIFNKAGIPLAERLTFINNKEFILPAKLTTDTVDFSPASRNNFTLSMEDTITGSFSVSVTDPAYQFSNGKRENIYSSLLLTQDIRGYVHEPAWYFMENDSAEAGIDLVMMTNGWRRFTWKTLLNDPKAAPGYKDPGFITITGHINIRDTKKPLSDHELLVMISNTDSLSNSIIMIKTDHQGNFRLDSLVFFESVRFLISDIRGKKSKWLDVYPDDSVTITYSLSRIDPSSFTIIPPDAEFEELSSKLAYDYDIIQRASGLMLEGVTVKAKKKTPVQELEEKYASGLFSGFSEKTIDLVNTDEADHYRNVFEYLQTRIPGLQVEIDGLDYNIYYRQAGSISSMGKIPMTLYLDEMETDASIISTVPANQVAMVKIYSTFVGAGGNGPGGALAVYTKKGNDLSTMLSSSADMFRFKGYSLIREFYSPDYRVIPKQGSPRDNRITLQWLPDIFVNAVNPKIPISFFNNDRTRTYKVIVEGLNWDGKMVFLEKIIRGR
jgi:hypothetical protein